MVQLVGQWVISPSCEFWYICDDKNVVICLILLGVLIILSVLASNSSTPCDYNFKVFIISVIFMLILILVVHDKRV